MSSTFQLLSTGTDAKTVKGEKFGWQTFILYLAPHIASGRNVCPWASKGCAAACLNTAGRGAMKSVQDARLRKTRWFFEDREGFMKALESDIDAAAKLAMRNKMKPCIRLNGTSDIGWERVIASFPTMQFYDYTKSKDRILAPVPANYHLTFSRSEENEADALDVLSHGKNVAVVFSSSDLPEHWNGYGVIDGDESDLRFLDEDNVVVGLKAKGKARQDTSGFVVPV